MEISTRHLLLWAIADVQSRPNGRAYLQKLCFFVGRILGVDFGHRANHFGPYSDLVASEMSYLLANGYAFQTPKYCDAADSQGWEVPRADFRLTDRGEEGLRWLDVKYSQEAEQVRAAVRRVLKAGDLNYIGLSVAAQVFWTLSREGRAATQENVRQTIHHLPWSQPTEHLASAQLLDFLRELGLQGGRSRARDSFTEDRTLDGNDTGTMGQTVAE